MVVDLFEFQDSLNHELPNDQHYVLRAGNKIIFWNQTRHWFENLYIVNDEGDILASEDFSSNTGIGGEVIVYVEDEYIRHLVIDKSTDEWVYDLDDEGCHQPKLVYKNISYVEMQLYIHCNTKQRNEISSFFKNGRLPADKKIYDANRFYEQLDLFYKDGNQNKWGDAHEIQYRGDTGFPGQLYVGDYASGTNYFFQKAFRIDTVVDCIVGDELPEYHIKFLKGYFRVNVWDRPNDDDKLQVILEDPEKDILGNIYRCLKTGNVLIYCYNGVSLSPTIAACYLMKYEGYTLNNVLTLIKGNRRIAFETVNFIKTLRHFDKNL